MLALLVAILQRARADECGAAASTFVGRCGRNRL